MILAGRWRGSGDWNMSRWHCRTMKSMNFRASSSNFPKKYQKGSTDWVKQSEPIFLLPILVGICAQRREVTLGKLKLKLLTSPIFVAPGPYARHPKQGPATSFWRRGGKKDKRHLVSLMYIWGMRYMIYSTYICIPPSQRPRKTWSFKSEVKDHTLLLKT